METKTAPACRRTLPPVGSLFLASRAAPAPAPVACPECEGTGQQLSTSDHWSPLNEHWTTDESVDCRRCRGTGELRCESCGKPGAVLFHDAPGDKHPAVWCAACYEAEPGDTERVEDGLRYVTAAPRTAAAS